ncbi:MAG: phosphate signaling complex protein PhoU [Lysobacterales bacterium]|jgi:phosphate transport system protein
MDKLNLGQHISRQFNEELEDVRAKVLHMGGIVEQQVSDAVRALLGDEPDLARKVKKSDTRVNSLEVEIDDECTSIVVRRQPAATDLRLIMAVIKTINDLERIGDEAKRVAKMSQEDLGGIIQENMQQELGHMGELVREMLHNVLDAFARTDVDMAASVVKADSKVDRKYKSITRKLTQHMSQDPESVPLVMNLLWATRSLERMGDRCQNIAEYVIYMVLGTNVQHTNVDDVLAEIESRPE